MTRTIELCTKFTNAAGFPSEMRFDGDEVTIYMDGEHYGSFKLADIETIADEIPNFRKLRDSIPQDAAA